MDFRHKKRRTGVDIKLPNGEMIKRVPKVTQMGNFQMMTIIYKNDEYIIGNGAEYLQGFPEYFELGKKLK
jgi:hypothetical protein